MSLKLSVVNNPELHVSPETPECPQPQGQSETLTLVPSQASFELHGIGLHLLP